MQYVVQMVIKGEIVIKRQAYIKVFGNLITVTNLK